MNRARNFSRVLISLYYFHTKIGKKLSADIGANSASLIVREVPDVIRSAVQGSGFESRIASIFIHLERFVSATIVAPENVLHLPDEVSKQSNKR